MGKHDYTTDTILERWESFARHADEDGAFSAADADTRETIRQAFYGGALAALDCMGARSETFDETGKRLIAEIGDALGNLGGSS